MARPEKKKNGTSWTPNSQLKIPKHALIYTGASSPGASQTLSHLSLKTPCEVRCGQRILLQKGKEGFERKGHLWVVLFWGLIFNSSAENPNHCAYSLGNCGSPYKADINPRILAHRKRPGVDGFGTPTLLLLTAFMFITSLGWRFCPHRTLPQHFLMSSSHSLCILIYLSCHHS